MFVTTFHLLSLPPVIDPAVPDAKLRKGNLGMSELATRILATPGSSTATSTSKCVLIIPLTSNSKCPAVAIDLRALPMSNGEVMVTDGLAMDPSGTLVYVPETRSPITGKSRICTLIDPGGSVLREICAAASLLAAAGSGVVERSNDRAAVAAAVAVWTCAVLLLEGFLLPLGILLGWYAVTKVTRQAVRVHRKSIISQRMSSRSFSITCFMSEQERIRFFLRRSVSCFWMRCGCYDWNVGYLFKCLRELSSKVVPPDE
jgi:hypothetical protein